MTTHTFARAAIALVMGATIVLAGQPQPAAATERGCTYTQGFWKTHPERWTDRIVVVGREVYEQQQVLVIFDRSPKGDATYVLAHQYMAAVLNGGQTSSTVGYTLFRASELLAEHPLGSRPKGEVRDQMIALAATLDDYNNGIIGPGHCD